MSLIYFNNVIHMHVPEMDMIGLFRVVAISHDVAMVALTPIPSISTSGTPEKLIAGIRDIQQIPMAVLDDLQETGQMHQVELVPDPKLLAGTSNLNESERKIYDRRLEIMRPFLDHDNLSWALFSSSGLGLLVREAKHKFGCSRTTVYKLFSVLCIHGFIASSLNPRFDRCGAVGIARPCDGRRRKAGRKTNLEIVGNDDHLPQRGTTQEERVKILALYRALKKPNLADSDVYKKIIQTLYVTKYQTSPVGIEPIIPIKGTFPNLKQFRYIIHKGVGKIARLKMTTTEGHYNRNKRGLKGKAWQNMAGPGHCYAIDSTIADVFLRSSVNRSWVCGRPIVYIIVDVWSTAVVGFYVCWSGPSWEMAKVALFCACAGHEFISNLWGFEDCLRLNPQPTLPSAFLCDRGEYLSIAGRSTTQELGFGLDFNPSYRPDLKGSVEVLHRITKDQQYAFIPGAIDARRKELELHGTGNKEAVLTLQEYAQYLTIIFNAYNFSADRAQRLDTDMIADGAEPTPAGLWRWGHQSGLGYRKSTPSAKLITGLLPQQGASINRNGLYFSGLQYDSVLASEEQWTAHARNFGSMQIPIHYFPGTTSRIWWQGGAAGLSQFDLSPLARAKPTISFIEWLDAWAVSKLHTQDREYLKTYEALLALGKTNQIVEIAREATAAAEAIYSGPQPNLRVVRDLERSIIASPSATSVSASTFNIQNQGVDDYTSLMSHIFSLAGEGDSDGK